MTPPAEPPNPAERRGGAGSHRAGRGEDWLEAVLSRHPRPREALVHVLHELHDRHGRVPRWAVDLLAARLGLSPVQVHGVLSFHPTLDPAAGSPTDRPRGSEARSETPAETGGPRPALAARLDRLLSREPEALLARLERWAEGSKAVAVARFGEGLRRLAGSTAAEKVLVCTSPAVPGAVGPGDGELLLDPESVVVGMSLVGRASGATRALACVPPSARTAATTIPRAARRLAGSRALGLGLEITVLRGFSGPVVDEPSALVAALEGRRGTPTALAPDPGGGGLWGSPTLVTTAEVLAAVADVLIRDRRAPTIRAVVDGAVARPGCALVRDRSSLRDLVTEGAGGPERGRQIAGLLLGGVTGSLVPASALDEPLLGGSTELIARRGGVLRVTVIAEGDCVVGLARRCLEAAASVSCGACVPCRLGLATLAQLVERLETGCGSAVDLAGLESLGRFVAETSMCSLGRTAPEVLLSAMLHFGEQFRAHLGSTRCDGVVTSGMGAG